MYCVCHTYPSPFHDGRPTGVITRLFNTDERNDGQQQQQQQQSKYRNQFRSRLLSETKSSKYIILEIANNYIQVQGNQSFEGCSSGSIFSEKLTFGLFATDANNWTRNMPGWQKEMVERRSKNTKKKLEELIRQDTLLAEERRMILHAILQCDAFPKDKILIFKIDNEINQNILLEVLLQYPAITRLVEFTSFYETPTEQRLGFCTKLCTNNTSSTSLYHLGFEGLHDYYPCDVQTLMMAIAKSSVKVLNLNSRKNLETVYKNRIPYPQKGFPIKLDALLSAFMNPLDPFRLESLEVGGNIVESTETYKEFVTTLPSLSDLKRLSFCGCRLSEEVLLALVENLKYNKDLTFLDLSHNPLSFKVIKELSLSLEANARLKTLKLEHCNIDLEGAACLAKSLPKINFVEELYLDGNPFTWKPLTEEKQSKGALLIMQALESNHSLSILKMGEHNKVLPCYDMICCTEPSYNLVLNIKNRSLVESYLNRNKALMKEFFINRARQATVRISGILLTKMLDCGC